MYIQKICIKARKQALEIKSYNKSNGFCYYFFLLLKDQNILGTYRICLRQQYNILSVDYILPLLSELLCHRYCRCMIAETYHLNN